MFTQFFFQLDNLELHIRSHSTDRPFTCEHCDKSYKDAPSLYSHIQTHHSIGKIVRNVPERNSTSSVQRSIFTPNLIILFFFLIAKRSHLCSECGASFMKSDHLKRHINSTHRKIKTIKCGFCDMMFSDKYKAKVCKDDNYIGAELSKRKTCQINAYLLNFGEFD